jgi:hypothetical protein
MSLLEQPSLSFQESAGLGVESQWQSCARPQYKRYLHGAVSVIFDGLYFNFSAAHFASGRAVEILAQELQLKLEQTVMRLDRDKCYGDGFYAGPTVGRESHSERRRRRRRRHAAMQQICETAAVEELRMEVSSWWRAFATVWSRWLEKLELAVGFETLTDCDNGR